MTSLQKALDKAIKEENDRYLASQANSQAAQEYGNHLRSQLEDLGIDLNAPVRRGS